MSLKKYFLLALVLCGILTEARAGNITGIGASPFPGSSTGTIGPVGSTPSPNNDNTSTPSTNVINYSIFYNTFGTLDVEFVVANAGGATEYLFTQAIINNTGQTWTGFHFELGYGVRANFVRSGTADGLDFDTPGNDPSPTSTLFAALNHQDDTLDWTAGSVPSIGFVFFSFSIDVPDNLTNFNPDGLNRFTLRQIPNLSTAPVPEPATILLLGAGLAGIGGILGRRK